MSALSFAALGVTALDAALDFYVDTIGFDVVGRGKVGTHTKALLGIDRAMDVECALLSACCSAVGRLLMLEFSSTERVLVREPGDRTTRGLWNLNFYVDDIRATHRALCARGFEFWSSPVEYELGAKAGRAIEVLFEAPDGVAINLVQPLGDEDVFTGRVRRQADAFGRTRTGFTPVATTAHCVSSIDESKPFYEQLLGLDVVLDERLGKPETNHFLSRPADALSRTVFLAGDHFFGKVSLNEPLNYAVPERVGRAAPPNIGYLAQGFLTSDLDGSLARALELGGTPHASPGVMDCPGFEEVRAGIIRMPGSGALLWLVER